MATTNYHIDGSIEAVFSIIVDPATYPQWLVGAQEIRWVDPDWPMVGSTFRHRVGLIGPLMISDSTRVLDCEAPHTLVLDVRARPIGRGRVTFRLEQLRPRVTNVTIIEVPAGRLRYLSVVLGPMINMRNRRSLQHLAGYLTRT